VKIPCYHSAGRTSGRDMSPRERQCGTDFEARRRTA